VETNQQLRRFLLATAMTSIRISVLPAANAPVPSIEPPAQRSVNVYLENIPDLFWNVGEAKTIASQIFSAIGVKLIWISFHDERTKSRDGTILVKVSAATPIDFRPRALAQSSPYEGTRAQVFYDRVRQRVTPSLVPALLGHVLAHEIGHLLEGTDGHADSGVMKAFWGPSDYDQMARGHLTFTDGDIRLIYAGLDARPKVALTRIPRTSTLTLVPQR
jgi:hypothetical protein